MAKHSAAKTNAMRALDARHIPYTTAIYDEAIHSANGVAEVLGVPVSAVYKTLVVFADGGRKMLVVTPGGHELDMRRVARAVHAKSATMASQQEAERLTGLKVGGISPLALLNKRFEVYLDDSASALDELYINGGQRGINLRLRVADLIAVTGARVIEATEPAGSAEPSA